MSDAADDAIAANGVRMVVRRGGSGSAYDEDGGHRH